MPDTISKTESRALPSNVVAERVMHQLAGIITKMPAAPSARPVRPLSQLTFYTTPRPGDVPGLCETDGMTVSFAKSEHGDAGPDTQVAVEGVAARPWYGFTAAPQKDYLSADKEYLTDRIAARQAREACGKLDPTKDHFFEAPDSEAMVNGYIIAGRIAAALKTPQGASFDVDCKDAFVDDRQMACQTVLARRGPEQIVGVGYCDPVPSQVSAGTCYTLDFDDDYEEKVLADISIGAGDKESTIAIRRVSLHGLIVLRHRVVD